MGSGLKLGQLRVKVESKLFIHGVNTMDTDVNVTEYFNNLIVPNKVLRLSIQLVVK